MFKVYLLTAAAVLSVVSAPVSARDARPTTSPEPTAENARPRAEASRVKYCVMDETTGSRIARKICRTREEWLSEGFDPLAPK